MTATSALQQNAMSTGTVKKAVVPAADHIRSSQLRAAEVRKLNMQKLAAVSAANSSCQLPEIHLIATDVDGTLLNSRQELTPRVRAAVLQAQTANVQIIVATGKVRGGKWARQILPQLGPAMPGVFMQGLCVHAADGSLLYSRHLERSVVEASIEFANQHGVTVTAYCMDRVFCSAIDEHTNRLLFYGEPEPEAVGNLLAYLDTNSKDVHKLILLASEAVTKEVRAELKVLLEDSATLTAALPGMIEVLPPGASKGSGVARLLRELGVEPQHVMAIGDGENDVENLQLAGVSVAMANAVPQAKAVAEYTVASNDEDGVAEAIERFVLLPRGLSLQQQD